MSIVATDESEVDLMNITATAGNVILDEESLATVNVSESLSYDITEESVLRYYGAPDLGATSSSDESKAIDAGVI